MMFCCEWNNPIGKFAASTRLGESRFDTFCRTQRDSDWVQEHAGKPQVVTIA
jgi:hypothetical protein